MPLGLRLRITNTSDGTSYERVFEHFPVRLGRHPLSDLQLDAPFVSQFHAVLELNGTQLLIRDLGSSNGTELKNVGRIAPNQPVDLAAAEYEFAILGLLFKAFAIDLAPSRAPRRMRGSRFAVDPAELAEMRALPVSSVADAKRDVQGAVDAHRSAWVALYEQISRRISTLAPEQRALVVEELAAATPALLYEPDFQRLAAFVNARVARAPGAAGPEEALTFQVLREFAASFVDGASIDSAKDAIAFLLRVQETLDTFLEAFVPLRDGHHQFRSQLDIERLANGGAHGSTVAVDSAKNPREIARALLDWRAGAADSTHALRSSLADIMMHQVALLDGMMRGVKALLAELSPATIEATMEKKRGDGGLRFGPFRFGTLWRLYSERHSDLADEEKEAFRLIFGPDFVRAYSKFGRVSGKPQPTGVAGTLPAAATVRPPPAGG